MTRAAEASATRTIHRAAVAAAGISVVLSPLPLADELALLPLYALLTVRVARTRGRAVRDVPWRPLAKIAFVGLAIRGAVDVTTSGIPGVAAVVNATTAVALTKVYGACVDRVCREPAEVTAVSMRDVLDAMGARPST